MNPVVVRNVAIGEGIPKICVPIVGKTREEILDAAKKILPIGADVVEWRVDWYEDIFDFEKVEQNEREIVLTVRMKRRAQECPACRTPLS